VHGEITVLSPRVAGYVVEITADDDQPVQPNQVVVRIDPRDYRATYNRAHAEVSQAETQLRAAKAQQVGQGTKIAVAEAALTSATGQARNAEIILGRARALLGSPAGNQSVFDNAQAAEVTANAAVVQAQANLGYEHQQLEVASAAVEVAAASVLTARATAYSARIALEDTDVLSPLAGVVAARLTRVGEYVVLGTRMLSIVPRDGLWIEANMRETQVGGIATFDPVRISMDTYRGKPVCGYVEAVAPAAASEFALLPPDNATGNFTKIVRRFTVRIRPNATDPNANLLRPGMSTEVRVATGSARDSFGCKVDKARDIAPSRPLKLPDRHDVAPLGLPADEVLPRQ
jgi:membrane fusion protein (multidrug efflux system)